MFHSQHPAGRRWTRCGVLFLPFVAMLVFRTVPVRAETPLNDEERLCLNAKAKAAAKKAKKVLEAIGKNEKKPNPAKLAAALAAAESKFANAFAKAEERWACRTTGDAVAIGAKVDAHAAEVGKHALKALNPVRSPRYMTGFAPELFVSPRAILKGNPPGTTLLFYPPDSRIPEELGRCTGTTATHRHEGVPDDVEHVGLNDTPGSTCPGDDCPNDVDEPTEIHVPFCSVGGPQELVNAKAVVGWVTCRHDNGNAPASLTIPNIGGLTFEYRGSATGSHAGMLNIYWFLLGGCAEEHEDLIDALPVSPVAAPVTDPDLLAPLYVTGPPP